mmetsp:Transcript_30026/g.71443  ORF Transcript_30026/g.71443 Transcript_30026/m.71443 type:complete len:93 (-) Transcript_30026:52-330(-)
MSAPWRKDSRRDSSPRFSLATLGFLRRVEACLEAAVAGRESAANMRITKHVKMKARNVDRMQNPCPYGKDFLPTLRESGATMDGSPLFIIKF